MTLELVWSSLESDIADNNGGYVRFDAPTAGNLLVIIGINFKSVFDPGISNPPQTDQNWLMYNLNSDAWDYVGETTVGETSFAMWTKLSDGTEGGLEYGVFHYPEPPAYDPGPPIVYSENTSTAWAGEFSGLRGTGTVLSSTTGLTTSSLNSQWLNQLVFHVWALSVLDDDPVVADIASLVNYNGTDIGDLQVFRQENDAWDDLASNPLVYPFMVAIQAVTYTSNGTKPGLTLGPGGEPGYTDVALPGAYVPEGSLLMPPPQYSTKILPGVEQSVAGLDPFDDDWVATSIGDTRPYPEGFDDDFGTMSQYVALGTETLPSADTSLMVPRYPPAPGGNVTDMGSLFTGGVSNVSSSTLAMATSVSLATGVAEVGDWQVATLFMRGGTGLQGIDGITIDGSDGWVQSDYWSGSVGEDDPEFYVFSRRTVSSTSETAVFSWTDSRNVQLAIRTISDITHSQTYVAMTAATPSNDTGDRDVVAPSLTTVSKDSLVFRYYLIYDASAGIGDGSNGPMQGMYKVSNYAEESYYDQGAVHWDSFFVIDVFPDPGATGTRTNRFYSNDSGYSFAFTFCPPSDPLVDEGDEDEATLALADDVDYYQVQLSRDANFTNVVRTERAGRTTSKTFRVKKPRAGRFYARVRSVDERGNKSEWIINNEVMQDPPTPLVPSLSFDYNEDETKLRGVVTTLFDNTWEEDDISRYEFVLNPTQWTKLDVAMTVTDTTMFVTGPNSDYDGATEEIRNNRWYRDVPDLPFVCYFNNGEQVLVTSIGGAQKHRWKVTRGYNSTTAKKHAINVRVYYFPKNAKGMRRLTVHTEDPDETTKVRGIFNGIPNKVAYKAKVRAISRDSRMSPFSDWTDALVSQDGATTGDIGGGGGGADPGVDTATTPSYPYERILRMRQSVNGFDSDAFTTDSGKITAFRTKVTRAAISAGPLIFTLKVAGQVVARSVIPKGRLDSGLVYIDPTSYGATDEFVIEQTEVNDAEASDLEAYVHVTLDGA